MKFKSVVKQWLINLPNHFYLAKQMLKLINMFRSERILANKAEKSNEVFSLVKSLSIDVYPFFGTLLNIHRDGKIVYADDFDFASTNRNVISAKFIQEVESLGAKLVAFSVVQEDQIVELSFELNGAKIDFFYLEDNGFSIVHRCPNFRKERAEKEIAQVETNYYKSYFEVEYVKFDVQLSEEWGMLLPVKPEDIFNRHYGLDWRTPKMSNFVDYSQYNFVSSKSYTCIGDHAGLMKKLMSDKLNLLK